MLQRFLLLMMVVISHSVFANHEKSDTGDCSKHHELHDLIMSGEITHHDGKVRPSASLRFLYEGKVSIDARAMLPYRNTFTLGIGHTFELKSDGCLAISPGIYLHTGEYLGVSSGFFMRYMKKKWFILHTQQMVVGFNKKSEHNFFSITTFDYQILKRVRFDIGAELECIIAAKEQKLITHSEHNELVPTRKIMFGPQVRYWITPQLKVETTFLQDLERAKHQQVILGMSFEF